MNPPRTSLLIRCSSREAAALRAQAADERRTIAGCLLNILDRSLWIEERYSRGITKSFMEKQSRSFRLAYRSSNRTSMLLRCSVPEADRIRGAAWKRDMSISEFVVFSLWRHWQAVRKIHPGAPPGDLEKL